MQPEAVISPRLGLPPAQQPGHDQGIPAPER
jgi:hypothetical protein